MKFLEQVKKTIEGERLFASSDLLLVALSGGADSVALLYVLRELGYRTEAVHCNFHLRGDESLRDELFVRRLCDECGLTLHIRHFETESYAVAQRISLEMAARSLRYEYFEELRIERNARYIVVGHHRDDNVETMLLNLMRGSGLHGLCGIKYVYGNIVRPLLTISRERILDYLTSEGYAYVIDSSNLKTDFTRNRVRLQLLPLMRSINPSIDATLEQTIERFKDVSLIYDAAIGEGIKRVSQTGEEIELCIDIELLLKESAPRSLFHELLYPYGFPPAMIAQAFDGLNSLSGAKYETQNMILLRNRNEFLLKKKEMNKSLFFEEMELPLNDTLKIDDKRGIRTRMLRVEDLDNIPKTKSIACVDADKLDGRLTLRQVVAGDRFVPFGMTGRKLLSDYFTDRKFSLFEKQRQLVVCCGERIVWLVGERLDNRFRIDLQTAQNILQMECVDL